SSHTRSWHFREIQILSSEIHGNANRLLEIPNENRELAVDGLPHNDSRGSASPVEVALRILRNVGRLRLAGLKHGDFPGAQRQLTDGVCPAPGTMFRKLREI